MVWGGGGYEVWDHRVYHNILSMNLTTITVPTQLKACAGRLAVVNLICGTCIFTAFQTPPIVVVMLGTYINFTSESRDCVALSIRYEDVSPYLQVNLIYK